MSRAAEASPPERFRALLDARLPGFGLSPGESALDRLARFLAHLDRWRSRINLTGRLSAEDLVSHTLESVFGAAALVSGARVVDIGTGGGFPGVPIAIWRPDLELTWLEPREKRATFLRHVKRTLGILNARVAAARARDLPRAGYDAATARAVGSLSQVVGGAEFLKPRGLLVVWTTEPESLAGQLSPEFSLESVLGIPASRRRAIALYRHR